MDFPALSRDNQVVVRATCHEQLLTLNVHAENADKLERSQSQAYLCQEKLICGICVVAELQFVWLSDSLPNTDRFSAFGTLFMWKQHLAQWHSIIISTLYPALWWVLLLWTRMVPPHSGASWLSPSGLHLQTETEHQHQARDLQVPENAAVVVPCGSPHRALVWSTKTSVLILYSPCQRHTCSELLNSDVDIMHQKTPLEDWMSSTKKINLELKQKQQIPKKGFTCTEDPRNQTTYNDTAHFVIFLDIIHSLRHLKDIFGIFTTINNFSTCLMI